MDYEKLFIHPEHQKEWDNCEPLVKNTVINNLRAYAEAMTNTASIEMLANAINELHERIKKLEQEKND